MLFKILRIKPIFGDFVIGYQFSMLFDAGLSIVGNRAVLVLGWDMLINVCSKLPSH